MSANGKIELVRGYRPGAIGRVTDMHATYYSREWAFDQFFEARIATEFAAFVQRLNPDRDLLALALRDGRIIGSIVIDGSEGDGTVAHLRWFIVDDDARGTGAGRRLMADAMAFCREKGFSSVYLYTFAGLDAAVHLYEDAGFTLAEAFSGDQWGKTVTEQRYERDLA